MLERGNGSSVKFCWQFETDRFEFSQFETGRFETGWFETVRTSSFDQYV